jgi:hypothetical protein
MLIIRNNGTKLFVTGRMAEMTDALMKGPVDCPSRKRNSATVHRLRCLGLNIKTEWVRGVGAPYGVYHLREKLRRATKAEEAAHLQATLKAVAK